MEAEAQRARDAEKAACEEARELRLAELKEARELRELELKAEAEKEAAAHELPELELKAEADKEPAARKHELKMAGLGIHPPKDKSSAFDPARNIRLVPPPFQEKEVDKYFAHFEKVADSLNRPKESWVLLLQSVLVSKVQEIYGSLSVEQSFNYVFLSTMTFKLVRVTSDSYLLTVTVSIVLLAMVSFDWEQKIIKNFVYFNVKKGFVVFHWVIKLGKGGKYS